MISETTSVLAGAAVRLTGDVVSVGIVLGTLAKILPPLAALISIIWIGFQFYHSEPMKERRKKRQNKE